MPKEISSVYVALLSHRNLGAFIWQTFLFLPSSETARLQPPVEINFISFSKFPPAAVATPNANKKQQRDDTRTTSAISNAPVSVERLKRCHSLIAANTCVTLALNSINFPPRESWLHKKKLQQRLSSFSLVSTRTFTSGWQNWIFRVNRQGHLKGNENGLIISYISRVNLFIKIQLILASFNNRVIAARFKWNVILGAFLIKIYSVQWFSLKLFILKLNKFSLENEFCWLHSLKGQNYIERVFHSIFRFRFSQTAHQTRNWLEVISSRK